MRPLRFAATAVALAVFAAGGFFAVGPERIWALFAEADQGPADLGSLRRRSYPNDSLACSTRLCPAPVDVPLPAYPLGSAALMDALDDAVLADPNVSRVDDRTRPDYRRYVARTPVMRFPDTVDALARPEATRHGGTGLVLYSRSLFGRGDWGTNRSRLTEWAVRLADAVRARAGAAAKVTS